MSRLSNRVNALAESQTILMAQKSRELRAQGHDVISLSLGEPNFDTPELIREAAKKAIDDNFNSYTAVAGYLELRKAISLKFKRDNQLDYTPAQIVVSTGAKQSIANVALSLLNPGDEVLVPVPYWVSYEEIIKLAEGKPVFVPSTIETDFKVSAQQIEAAITDRTRMLIFSSPCNPTGSVYTKEELKAIAEVIAKYEDIYIVSDEIYEYINYTGIPHQSIAQFDFIKDRVITVNGVSKAFSMAGWRLGYMGAPQWLAKACDKIQSQVTSATSSITQKAVEAAMLRADHSIIDPIRESFRKRRDFMLEKLKEIPEFKVNKPEGAFYIFPDVSHFFGNSDGEKRIESANDLCLYLLDQARVAFVPGEAFGMKEYIRISYAAPEEVLDEAIKRVKGALEKLH